MLIFTIITHRRHFFLTKAANVDDLSGQTLKGYDIVERIGTGKFGAVYRANQCTIQREVAIKAILPDFANHPDFIRRFETEAQLIARLEHPHIVPLFDYWREPDCAYLVMRLLPSNLRIRLEQGRLLTQEIIRLVDQIASALAISHRQGVVHRDIKPDNILLDTQGNAYLSDFGLAKVLQSGRSGPEDNITGSPAYMSPEQITGETVTAQADLYALGVVIFEMLTGTHPYAGLRISELIQKHLYEPLPSITALRPELGHRVDYVLQRATAKHPDERYTDTTTLAVELRQALLEDNERTMQLTVDTAIDVTLENPYKGLRAFTEADAGDFFGREALVEQIIATLAETHDLARFLAVVGPSGSGKSSLVQAGVVPALRKNAVQGSDQWFIVGMVPGAHPCQELERVLLSVATQPIDDLTARLRASSDSLLRVVDQILTNKDGDLLLVIDQFEEVFTLVEDERERAQFLALLRVAVTAPASRLRLIVTLRADFYDRPLLYEDFGTLFQQRTHVVLPLTEIELERAITTPAARVGVQLEPNLITAIVSDVYEEPGALPLLQYALTEVFERRKGRTMTLRGYQDIGRVAGALARRAERVFSRLTSAQQGIARQIFLRLVTLGEGSNDIRRRTDRAELLSIVRDPAELQEVLDIFGRHRLLSFDHAPVTREPTVEVAHEALLREWRRLRDWLEASREDVQQQRRVDRLADEWLEAGKDPSFLLRGSQLEQFEQWLNRTNLALSDTEREYITASVIVREEQRQIEQAQREREAALEARAQSFLRSLLGVMFVAMLIAIGLSLIAFDQRSQAHDARDAAERNAQRAGEEAAIAATSASVASRRADELQALNLVENAQRALETGDFDLGFALALQANLMPEPPIRAQNLLGETAASAPLQLLAGHTDRVSAVAISPDGTHAISGAEDNTLIVWDLVTGAPLRTLTGHSGQVRSVAYLPGGDQALSGADDATLIVWDLATGEALRTLTGHNDDVFSVAVYPDGTRAVSGSRDRTLIVWDLATGEALMRLGDDIDGHQQRITCVAVSPDGTQVVSGSADNTLILWDLETGAILQHFEGHTDVINDVAFSPDGTQLLSASSDTTLRLWDVAMGRTINTLSAHTERVTSVAYSPDGTQAISGAGNPFAGASTDNTVILWDLFLGQPVRHYTGHSLHVNDVAFAPDGDSFISAAADNTLRVWPATYDVELAHTRPADANITALALTPNGDTGLAALAQNELLLLDLRDPAAPRAVRRVATNHSDAINAVAISPDGTRGLTASADRTLALWDLETGTLLHTLSGHTNQVNTVVFTSDGTQALSGSQDRTLILWDLTTGEALRTFATRHTNSVEAVAISPDGTQALSGSADQSVMLWDMATGETLKTLRGHTHEVTAVAFSPDGTQALSASHDKTLYLWDLTTGTPLHHLGGTGDGHTDWVTSVAFSPDGRLALSGSADRTVRLWNLTTGETIRVDTGHTDRIHTTAITASGELGITASGDGVLRTLPLTPEAFTDWVRTHRYVRELTSEEREQYRIEDVP